VKKADLMKEAAVILVAAVDLAGAAILVGRGFRSGVEVTEALPNDRASSETIQSFD
jgi:hypothetical protein